ncbi:hypothetical protein QWZ13_10230 [Reinekea marina]|uniref:hypothetical protein n=1 Tax=Reinekea marina TaxID=1310421 RepID=UPI0025B5D720|nr:hypothetical protein [Reinekea marina]MDN3649290.1 hypothetical protein [Reinekea marina]
MHPPYFVGVFGACGETKGLSRTAPFGRPRASGCELRVSSKAKDAPLYFVGVFGACGETKSFTCKQNQTIRKICPQPAARSPQPAARSPQPAARSPQPAA